MIIIDNLYLADFIILQVILQNDYLGQPCNNSLNSSGESLPNSASHFLYEESQSSSCSNSIISKPRCVVCSARNPTREHLANHFMSELVQDLDGDTLCSQCDFDAPDGKALVLHNVSKHDGTSLDKILQDAACVSSKRAEVEARGHRQSLGPLCPICDQQMHKSHGM